MKDSALTTQFSPRSRSLRSRSAVFCSTLALSAIGLLANQQPSDAMSFVRIERTEESEKCEWLGVCDAPKAVEQIEASNESDRCTWLGICDQGKRILVGRL